MVQKSGQENMAVKEEVAVAGRWPLVEVRL